MECSKEKMKQKIKSKIRRNELGTAIGAVAGGALAFFTFQVVPYGASILGFDVTKTNTMFEAIKWLNQNPNGFIHPLAGIITIFATMIVGGFLGMLIEKELKGGSK
jgi:hypothetical protein